MGYLEELRREREVRLNPKPVEPRPKSERELLTEWGKSVLKESGVSEVFKILEERDPYNKDVSSSDSASTEDDSYSRTLFLANYYLNLSKTNDIEITKWVTVTVLRDGSFIVKGRIERKIPRLEYQQSPNVVTDALGEAIKDPCVFEHPMVHLPTTPSSDAGSYG